MPYRDLASYKRVETHLRNRPTFSAKRSEALDSEALVFLSVFVSPFP
jgi:hypothetical protein